MEQPAFVWLIILIALVILESVTTQLLAIWFALGALSAIVVSLFIDSVPVQVLVFLVVSVVALILTKPYIKRSRADSGAKLNNERFIGETAVVIEDVDNDNASGLAKVLGQIWTARSEDGEKLAAGTKAVVTRIEGVKIFLQRMKEDS